MRGTVDPQPSMFFAMDLEEMVPADHPLRAIKQQADDELRRMRKAFAAAYSQVGRPSIPPEQLIKATLLQALFTIRSERLLCEQLRYNMLFRWFLGLPPDGEVWNHSTFSKNRERFAAHGLMQRFFEGSVAHAIAQEAASVDHFSVDGTLIEAWASMKSVRPKDESTDDDDPKPEGNKSDSNHWTDWRGAKRSNKTHESKTDPQARLMRKGPGKPAILSHSMHVLMENRNGLVMDIEVEEANGTAERQCAKRMIKRVRKRHWLKPKTLAADKGYDDGAFLHDLEKDWNIKPHVSIKGDKVVSLGQAADARRLAQSRQNTAGYQSSQRCRKRAEEIFGWLKTTGGLRKTRFIGRWKTQLYAYAAAAAYNFMRIPKLSET